MALDEIPEELGKYRSKRDFGRTPEPAGGEARPETGIFVVQKHAASHLHYDFRLELDGVLKSWAVPKGPSLDPSVKRLAMHVEDHPLEYASFEGIIPAGQYGGGTVMVWDSGYWSPEGDPRAGYRKGHLKFFLAGKKLHGKWVLVRGKTDERGRESWLLMKERDEAADTSVEVTAAFPLSAATGRTMEEIAAGRDAVWSSEEGRLPGGAESAPPVPGGKPAPLPDLLAPQLATLVKEPPPGEEWLHEIKYDGYRLLCRIDGDDVRLFTRKGQDWSAKFPCLVEGLRGLALGTAWLDGEAVVILPDGTTSFGALQESLSAGRDADIVHYLFDLLYLDGSDLRNLPLSRRKELLSLILRDRSGCFRYADHVPGNGGIFYASACRYRVEGIVSKRSDSPYAAGRGRSWVKVKCRNLQEFVIGGFSISEKGRGFRSLLLGVRDGEGRLRYSGKVGTGFSERSYADLAERLRRLVRPDPPFADPPIGPEARGVVWVDPELVAEVEYAERTREGVLRHSSFQGLREDKSADEVVIEEPRDVVPEDSPGPPPTEKRAGELPGGISLTNPEKVLYPESGLTKRDLAVYYLYIRPRMLPHLAGRVLTLVRCPEGIGNECFFQKHANETVPPQLRRVPLEEEPGTTAVYLAADDVGGLLGLVQMGILEIHTWNSRTERLEYPDRLVFDLDPDEGLPWERLAEGTLLLRTRLLELGLESFVKTTGGKGFHVVVPVAPERDWDEVKAFSRRVAEELSREHPAKFTPKMAKELRSGKIFLDWMRNIRGATAVEVYSTRRKPDAPLSVPVHWEEIAAGVRSADFTAENIGRRLAGLERDPWEDYFRIRQSLPKP
jgi:bifunctional non-homologous end joining protein LigD